MPRFLSEAWFAGINARQLEVDPELALTVDQHIGDIGYRVTLAGGRLSVGPPDPTVAAEATLALDRATAADLATGVLDASEALLTGRIKVSGNVSALAAALPLIATIRPALTEVRDATDF